MQPETAERMDFNYWQVTRKLSEKMMKMYALTDYETRKWALKLKKKKILFCLTKARFSLRVAEP